MTGTNGFGPGWKSASVSVPLSTSCDAFVKGENSRSELIGQCDKTCHAPVCNGCDSNFREIGRRGSPACYGCCTSPISAPFSSDHRTSRQDETKTYWFEGGAPVATNWLFQNATVKQLRSKPACKDHSAAETCSHLGGCRAQVWCKTAI